MLKPLSLALLLALPAQAHLVTASLSSLRPTQFAVGMKEVETKQRKLVELPYTDPLALDAFLRGKAFPGVIGPGHQIHILDRHHLGLALLRVGTRKVYVEVHVDLSHLSPEEFLVRMEAEGFLYLNDENGERKDASLLPETLWQMPDAPYRSFAYDVRKAGGYKKAKSDDSKALYSGWHWADFLRPRISLADMDYDEAVQCGVILARSPAASHLPGFIK